ncbi:Metallo-dependent phosphatase-like protein [Mycena floridula]|nr:Metallo-dependent phosphatase-like protein [Mycena floridula]
MTSHSVNIATDSARVYVDYDSSNPPPHSGAQSWTRFVCISDTHSRTRFPFKLPPGDVLLCSGDISSHGYPKQVRASLKWLKGLKYPIKIVISGNHDLSLDDSPDMVAMLAERSDTPFEHMAKFAKSQEMRDAGVHYLQYEPLIVASPHGKQWKIFGSPASPRHPRGAFQYNRDEGYYVHRQIPRDTEILLTHSPPYHTLDKTRKHVHAGCHALQSRMEKLPACRLHVFGHIHEAYGAACVEGRIAVNAAVSHAPCAVIVDLRN